MIDKTIDHIIFKNDHPYMIHREKFDTRDKCIVFIAVGANYRSYFYGPSQWSKIV